LETKHTVLIDILNSAEEQDYGGYSKFDALNSRFLMSLTLDNKWLRLISFKSKEIKKPQRNSLICTGLFFPLSKDK